MTDKATSGFTLTLKNNEEARLSQIFQSYSNDLGHMPLSDFLRLSFYKHLITNSTPMQSILNVFQQAAGEKTYLNKDRFFFAINLLSRIIFPDEIMPLDLIITKILTEYSEPSYNSIPTFDDSISILFNEGIIRMFEKAEEGFLNILMCYNSQNIANGRKVVGIQQIKNKNLGILSRNLMRFFKSKGLFPSILSVEEFQKVLEKIVPAYDKDMKKFYTYGFLYKFYDKEMSKSELSSIETIRGEPELRLVDLELLFGKIALDYFPMIEDVAEKVMEMIENKCELISQPKIAVKYSLDLGSDFLLNDSEGLKKIHIGNHKKSAVLRPFKENLDILALIKNPPRVPVFEEIEKMFDDERVPPFPDMVKPVQENPPPYILPPITYPIAKTSAQDRKESPKKENKNRSETPGVKVKFVELPGRFTSNSPEKPRYESFAEMRKNLNSSIYPETAKQMLSNPAIQPCLIREVFIPPLAPETVTNIIESSFAYQANSNYHAAFSALLKAKSQWLLHEKTDLLKPDIELFFEMAKGAIFESCKKDEIALGQYFASKVIYDRLGFNNPDRALLYCGLGSVLVHLGHYKLALRSYLMAKKIRERCIGGDTIETATVYNNLGVCMFFLSRYQESFAYFELSEAIFMMMLGPHHARTLTVKQNINKVKRQNLIATPDYKVLWSKQFVDPYPKRKKKGKGKKKKGKS
ncbi:hypothetical protein SteCoe_16057 [Stentor coeruleus]|uniref:CLU central domain-containing protein n=1 Tax=Stentor coeruleus TaxID=5963 RepID=A0A1R2C265_9CILI|nr:hypothetical protein SteCoe_16057 [Stentor coeruleus]